MWAIIFQLIINLPSIIKAVIEIIKLIRQIKDAGKKQMYQERLVHVLMRVNKNKKQVSIQDENELEQLIKDLKTELA